MVGPAKGRGRPLTLSWINVGAGGRALAATLLCRPKRTLGPWGPQAEWPAASGGRAGAQRADGVGQEPGLGLEELCGV